MCDSILMISLAQRCFRIARESKEPGVSAEIANIGQILFQRAHQTSELDESDDIMMVDAPDLAHTR